MCRDTGVGSRCDNFVLNPPTYQSFYCKPGARVPKLADVNFLKRETAVGLLRRCKLQAQLRLYLIKTITTDEGEA
jgi:hypothetical protein